MKRRPRFDRVLSAILATGILISVPAFSVSDTTRDPCNGAMLESAASVDKAIFSVGCPVTTVSKTSHSSVHAMRLNLPAPTKQDERRELGLSADKAHFQMGDLEADLLVVMVFDMYCHVCHQSSENMQAVADRLQNSAKVQSVCILGLGRGDTDFEVQTFVKKLGLKFPCISDRDKSVTDALGVRYTPSGFLFCRKTGEYRLLSSFSGYLSKKKAEEFLAPVFAADH